MTPEVALKLIRLPSFFRKRQFSSKPNCSLIPPLGLGLVAAHLRDVGFSVDQDDLNIRILFDNAYSTLSEDRIDVDLFFDEPRIRAYAKGGSDEALVSALWCAAGKTLLKTGQIILLSLPDNIENESNLLFALAFTTFLKKTFNPTIIMGGDNVWLDSLRQKYAPQDVDYFVYGEGELPLEALLRFLCHGTPIVWGEELTSSDNGRVIRFQGTRKPIKPDFKGLPMELYRSREEVLDYPTDIEPLAKQFQSLGALVLPYRLMRGCPFECAFCVSSTSALRAVLQPEEVADHLESLQKEYNPTGFFFLSDTINISRTYINRLCDEIIRRGLKIQWSDCARVNDLDASTLLKMRQAGCVRLIFGMETASPRLLEYINKKIDLAQLEKVLRWADEAGIWSGVEVICGLPHEHDEDVDATIRFLEHNKNFIDRIYLNHFDLRENTPLYNEPAKYGIRRIFDVSQYADKDFISYVRFGFDEENGLAWKDKGRQIERSLQKVQEHCARGNRYFTDEHLLFFLYANLKDKKAVRSVYLKILKPGS